MCLVDEAGAETQVTLPDYDEGAWHGFVPGISPGQAYGYRVRGPCDTGRGLRCNPAKLLLDPYARAVRGEVTFGPEVFDYDRDDHDVMSSLDSAGLRPAEPGHGARIRLGRRHPARGGTTPTRSSTRSTSRASPCAIRRCPRTCAELMPGWPMRPFWST